MFCQKLSKIIKPIRETENNHKNSFFDLGPKSSGNRTSSFHENVVICENVFVILIYVNILDPGFLAISGSWKIYNIVTIGLLGS
jgi:hypothetical protein